MKTIILSVLLLSGCASIPTGMQITEEERAACEAQGCSVWTRAELEQLVRAARRWGYEAGKASI